MANNTDSTHTITNLIDRIQAIYQASKKWVMYTNLFLIAGLLYLGDYLGPLREVLLPASIVSSIAILFETLSNLEKGICETRREGFATLAEAIPVITETLNKDRDTTTIEIITGPGATTFSSLMPVILSSCKAKRIDITLYMINPDSPLEHLFPRHWRDEALLTLQRARSQIIDQRVRLTIHLYDNLPVLRGVLIDKKHLVLGFFQWLKTANGFVLSGAEGYHIHCRQDNVNDEFFMSVFQNWVTNCPSQVVYQFPEVREPARKQPKQVA